MLTPCEVAVKCVIPVLRSMTAKVLTRKYGLTQKKTGDLLGITQAAVSQYLRKTRGIALDLEEDEEIDVYDSEVINKKSPRKTVPYSDIFD